MDAAYHREKCVASTELPVFSYIQECCPTIFAAAIPGILPYFPGELSFLLTQMYIDVAILC